ncbi:hypothetical protein [Alicyclobacillus acidocaldarius]|uniref:Lipoprotein n=1 Tax=Alicyclobacillus acidocaldarius (strain Tc-4-1) TaxID=1048834 RepID=F8II59_ALIAT|nr:hypothetical protein [Alicyclobacillus acidocaldarius]AEJ44539.1 hypothetical protein TC41_2644 [Alicyclobacillus acidocaldarius subsp. acidocaldarius Tc-4-1]
MKIPLTVVVALAAWAVGVWPSVDAWADASVLHHALAHALFLVSGGLLGFEAARYAAQSAARQRTEEREYGAADAEEVAQS